MNRLALWRYRHGHRQRAHRLQEIARLIRVDSSESVLEVGRASNVVTHIPRMPAGVVRTSKAKHIDVALTKRAVYVIVADVVVRYGMDAIVEARTSGIEGGPQFFHIRLDDGDRLLLALTDPSDLGQQLSEVLEGYEASLSVEDQIELYWRRALMSRLEVQHIRESRRRKLYDRRWNLNNVGDWLQDNGWIEAETGEQLTEGTVSLDHRGIRFFNDRGATFIPYEAIRQVQKVEASPELIDLHRTVFESMSTELIGGMASTGTPNNDVRFAIHPARGNSDRWLAELTYWIELVAAEMELDASQ